MSAPVDLAGEVADRMRRVEGPWDVYAQRSRRFEIHLNGPKVELSRGPIALQGYGVRLLRPHNGGTAIGFQSTTDFSDAGLRAVLAEAESSTKFSDFPAKNVTLPGSGPARGSGPRIVDPTLWEAPGATLDAYVAELIAAFGSRRGVALSFGSVKATLVESWIANSEGMSAYYPQTIVERELAVKAFGGPEGRPPGEYWTNDQARRLEPKALASEAEDWGRFAEDARVAKPPPNGDFPVALPPDVLEGILPSVLQFKFSGSAQLRGLAIPAAARLGSASLRVTDDGLRDWAVGSSGVDDEGTPQRARTLIEAGRASEYLLDTLHARALEGASNGCGFRTSPLAPGLGGRWKRFCCNLEPDGTTTVIGPGDGGTDAELIENVEHGIWVQQIGWAQPDPISGRFGGEIRIGYRIEHGKLGDPVRGGTVGGTVAAPDDDSTLLGGIVRAGSRAKLTGQLDCPTLLIRSLPISGRASAD